MKLIAFTLENYRSIKQSQRLLFGDGITTLIGPNNEGKSNILRALVAALKIVIRLSQRMGTVIIQGGGARVSLFGNLRHVFNWETDFPVTLQDAQPNGYTLFKIELELSLPEARRFQTASGRPLKGLLSIEVRCQLNTAVIWVRDDDTASSIRPERFRDICKLIADSIVPEYIPSVRTAESAQEIVEGIVGRALGQLEERREYRDARREILRMQQGVLRELSNEFTRTLREFIPSVKKVRVDSVDESDEEYVARSCTIVVNDGTKTQLSRKGDGVQSLAAMSLMRHVARKGAGKRKILLAVEEPETHLHSKAIYQIRAVLAEIALQNQVVITSHNPVFVNRETVGKNILVSANNASPASSLEQIREILGIRPSENLRHAEHVLIVEGEDDRIALNAIFAANSSILKSALANGVLAIDPLHGSSNLTAKLSLVRAALCSAFVFVDNDTAGRQAVERAIADRVIKNADVKYAICSGKRESELEDFYSLEICENVTRSAFGVPLVKPLIRGTAKWSDRVANCFRGAAQQWNDGTKASLKMQLAAAVAAAPGKALNPKTRRPIDALVKTLEEKLTVSLPR